MENGRAETVPPRTKANTQDLSDAKVVKAATEGQEWAWNLLVDRFAPAVWSVARTGDVADHEAAEIFRITWMRTADRLLAIGPNSIERWLRDTAAQERARVAALHGVRANT